MGIISEIKTRIELGIRIAAEGIEMMREAKGIGPLKAGTEMRREAAGGTGMMMTGNIEAGDDVLY